MQLKVDRYNEDMAKTSMSDQMLDRMQASADKRERMARENELKLKNA